MQYVGLSLLSSSVTVSLSNIILSIFKNNIYIAYNLHIDYTKNNHLNHHSNHYHIACQTRVKDPGFFQKKSVFIRLELFDTIGFLMDLPPYSAPLNSLGMVMFGSEP